MVTSERSLVHLLRSIPVRDLERALRRDGFILRRQTRAGSRCYVHPDGRKTVVHYHHGGDTLTRKTLASLLAATAWSEEDAGRLELL